MIVSDRGWFWPLVLLSLLLAQLLLLLPLPFVMSGLRPELICLLVIYWVLRAPQYLGVAFAFLIGLIQSVVELSVWADHALALTLCVYFVSRLAQRMNAAHLWQQGLYLAPLLVLHQLLVAWMQSLAGFQFAPLPLLGSALMSVIFWPFIAWSLDRLCRSYHLI